MTSTKTKGFTIVELLTVMSIIIILMSVLVPGLARSRRFSKVVVQRGQFHEISKGLELYRNDHQETYPDSGAVDTNATPNGYCGAMKLCEALLGQDGMGNHSLSSSQAKQTVYLFDLCITIDPGATAYTQPQITNLQERNKYTDAENIKAYRLRNVFAATWASFTTATNFYAPKASFDPALPNAVIGDVFQRADIKGGTAPTGCPQKAGQKVGMPVLYYKADPSKFNHDTILTSLGTANANIYNFDDNYALTALGCPWEGTQTTQHPMFTDPRIFLKAITNDKVTATPRPHNEDGYILLSAGWDGLYGTQDDVYNFAK
jgi:type II secretory pathway pseudopilin PulG